MATVVSGLTNYVPQNVNEVILAATFGTKFLTEAASKATVQAGVKTAATRRPTQVRAPKNTPHAKAIAKTRSRLISSSQPLIL